MSETAKIVFQGKEYELPVIKGSEGEYGIDISKLRAQSGLITLDIGFKNTGSTTSAITFLNGEEGVLRYRGYSIEDLTAKSSFLEVAWLLIYGELPTKAQHEKFLQDITMHTLLHEDMRKIFDGFPVTAHPMAVLTSLVSSLNTFYPETTKPHMTDDELYMTVVRILAKMPTIAAWSYKNEMGHPLNYPKNAYDYCTNFLYMMFAMPTEDYQPDLVASEALDKLLILHGDHEQNCSAATVRVVGSSFASLYAAVTAGINALWGERHGGANQAVIEMLTAIKDDGGDVKKYIEKAKDKDDPFRLMGFGHRVYKNFDPRARIIKKYCDEVLGRMGIADETLDIAKELEETALNDPYFAERKLYPNVDFYSGIIYRALGIPTEMFTVMFALGRLPGWIAQWKEMREDGQAIGRPRQIYTGYTARDFVDVEDRVEQTA